MVMRLSARRGQSMGEYAILFAIVLGAAIAMQQYVKARLQGGIAGTADKFMNTGLDQKNIVGWYGTFEPNRTTSSVSDTNLTMQKATTGAVKIDSKSNTTVNK